MGGGWRNVRRSPTAFSRATPPVGTSFSRSSSTKLARLACGHTSGWSSLRSTPSLSKVISHCRIHSITLSPQNQCESSPLYCSVSCSARSSLRCSRISSPASVAASMSSASSLNAVTPEGQSGATCISSGGGMISGGRIVHGKFGMAGEFGHISVVPNGNPCGCGNQGCLEKHASATAVSAMARLMQLGEDLTSQDVYELAKQQGEAGDKARTVWCVVGEALGMAMASLINTFNFPLYRSEERRVGEESR